MMMIPPPFFSLAFPYSFYQPNIYITYQPNIYIIKVSDDDDDSITLSPLAFPSFSP